MLVFREYFRKFLRNNMLIYCEFFEEKPTNVGKFFANFLEKACQFRKLFCKERGKNMLIFRDFFLEKNLKISANFLGFF